ncbi:MAG: hypothetical protein AAGG02_05480 [Cyanobacteria bacterium P01_H01_bin.15]
MPKILKRYRLSAEITLGESLGKGGEGEIFAVVGQPELAAKIYYPRLARRERAEKLLAMMDAPPADATWGNNWIAIAWVQDILLDDKQFVGFLMPRVAQGVLPIFDFYNPSSRREHCPLFDYSYLIRTALNLSRIVRSIHAKGYIIGDLNGANILVSETALVSFVDTDSFQVQSGERIFRCPVGRAEFTPPELQGSKFSQENREPIHDYFGLGVLIFQLLMEGIHPFTGRYLGEDEVPPIGDRIKAGNFPYLPDSTLYKPLPSAPPFSMLDPELQSLFWRCFVEGHAHPERRPTPAEWQDGLYLAEQNLTQCDRNPQHYYCFQLEDHCPWCARAELFGGRDPFPPPSLVEAGTHLETPKAKPSMSRSAIASRRTLKRKTSPPAVPKSTPPPPPKPASSSSHRPAVAPASPRRSRRPLTVPPSNIRRTHSSRRSWGLLGAIIGVPLLLLALLPILIRWQFGDANNNPEPVEEQMTLPMNDEGVSDQ